jgi:hypothetical protein
MTSSDLKAEALAQVEQLRRERDEARAEVERFRNAVREKERLELEAVRELDEARAERDHFKEIARQRSEDFLAANAERVKAVLKANNPSMEVPCGHCGTKFMAEEFTCGDCMDEVDDKYFVEAMRQAASEQREACAEACEKVLEEAEQNALTPGRVKTGIGAAVECVDAVRATPLVTEGAK